MTRRTKLAVLLLLPWILTACSPTGPQTAIAVLLQNVPGRIQRPLEAAIQVDATVDAPRVASAPVLLGEAAQYDAETLKNLLLPGMDIRIRRYTEDNKEITGEEQDVYFTSITGPGNEEAVWIGLQPGNVNFSGVRADQAVNILTRASQEELSSLPVELEKIHKADAIGQVQKAAQKLGVELYGEPTICDAMDGTWLRTVQERLLREDGSYISTLNGKTKIVWETADQFYYIEWDVAVGGIPRDPRVYFDVNGRLYTPSHLTALVDKNGLIMLVIPGIYSDNVVTQQPETLIPVQEALDTAIARWREAFISQMGPGNAEACFTRISLQYVALPADGKNRAYLTPTWCFEIGNTFVADGKNVNQRAVLRINAITGEEIR